MILYVMNKNGIELRIEDCCDHDLVSVQAAINQHHRRWLRRRKPHTIEIVTAKGRYVFLVADISAVALEAT